MLTVTFGSADAWDRNNPFEYIVWLYTDFSSDLNPNQVKCLLYDYEPYSQVVIFKNNFLNRVYSAYSSPRRWYTLQRPDVSCFYCLFVFPSDAQLTRERVIQTVDSALHGGDGRNTAHGLHQLPVRTVTQNGKQTSAVATATSLANASGKISQPHALNTDRYFLLNRGVLKSHI